MDSIRSRLIRLAHENPELRPALLPMLREATDFPTEKALKKYLKDHPGADKSKHTVKKKKPGHADETAQGMKQEADKQWDAAPGKAVTPATVKHLKPGTKVHFRTDLTTGVAEVQSVEDGVVKVKTEEGDTLEFSDGKSEQHRPLDRLKAEGKPGKSFKKNYRPKMESVMTKHNLTDDDAAEVIQFSIDRPRKGKEQTPAELMRRFMQNAKPETKERMKGMSPADFMVMLRAVLDEGEGAGKAANLRAQVIRLAHENPALRPHLLPLVKTAGRVSVRFDRELSIEDIEGSTPWGERMGQVAYLDTSKSGAKASRAAMILARQFQGEMERMPSGDKAIGFLEGKVFEQTGKGLRWQYVQLPM